MEVILTHENTDFDALASLLGASKLYPDAKPVLPRRLNRNLRHFLTLYCDELPFVQADELPRRSIERVILVDTQALTQLKGMSSQTKVRIIDHHVLAQELAPGMTYSGGETGATITLLIEQISEARLPLSPIEATLFLLGIYEDTGSLSYPSTTPRDVRCAAWLLEQGANLEVVNRFLHHPLSEEQRQLYDQLLENSQAHEFDGQSVVIATASVEGYIEEIATLAHKLRDLFEPAALFVLVELGEHIQLVARSSSESIDVAEIAAHFDGGGHSQAAAARIRGQSLAQAQARLLELLRAHIQPAATVGQIMSYGVHTLPPDTTVADAAGMMRRYGHEGFPVVQDGQIVGILTRSQIDRALQLGFDNVSVNFYMYKGEVSVRPDDSVQKLQDVMMEHSLGQVPVVEGGEVIGIVTRTDLIKLWSAPPQRSRKAEIAQLIEDALPAPLLELIQKASQTAAQMGFSLYVVGGFVRDLLLGIPTLDLDLVVEGDAIALARRLQKSVGGRVTSHVRFGTAKLILDEQAPLTGQAFPVSYLDFVTARTEFYEHPTALPQVERSSIKQDLHRRDFTINTLAVCLDPDRYGELLDFYGGEQDLKRGLIRVLHSLSFVEDPTRMLRAARLEQRLGFRLEERTEELIGNALGLLDRTTGERIRHELCLILEEEAPEEALCRLDELGVLAQIHPGLRGGDWLRERFRRLRALLTGRESTIWSGGQVVLGQVAPPTIRPSDHLTILYLALLTYRLSALDLESLVKRLKIASEDATLLRQVNVLRSLTGELAEERQASAIYRLLEHYPGPAIFLLWLATDSELVRERLELHYGTLRFVEPEIDGEYLKAMGLKPSPLFGHILSALRDACLDGKVSSLEEEEAFVEERLALLTGLAKKQDESFLTSS
ncbi:MAG: CBS domain-containing protein [Anaerolineales bacterium]|nr:CBS domain-containing protein [Anaerolineales bacterium]